MGREATSEKPDLKVVGSYDPVLHGWKETFHLLQAETKPVEWIIDRLIAPGTINILSGNSKVFKTWMLHSFMVGAATGGKVFGQFQCKKSRVMFVQAEESNRQHEQKFKWTVAGAELNTDQQINMHILSWCGRMKLGEPKDRDAFRRAFDEWLPNLVLVDSFRRTHQGNEREQETAQQMKDGIDEYLRAYPDSGWLLNHHHRKRSGDNDRDVPGEMLAGHGDLRAVVDGHFAISRDKKTSTITFTHDACRDAEELAPFLLRFRAHEGKAWFDWLGFADKTGHDDPVCALVFRELRVAATWLRTPEVLRRLSDSGSSLPDKKVRGALERLLDEGQIHKRPAGDGKNTLEWKSVETEGE